MITLTLFFIVFVFGFLIFITSKVYKNKYNRNMFFTFTSFGIFVSEFLIWMGLVLSSDLNIRNPDLKYYIQYDFSVAVVVIAALILLYCLILNMLRSSILFGIFQTAIQVILIAMFGAILSFLYLSHTEGSTDSH
jgi:hypothetical protein